MTLPKPYYETELGKLYHGDCLEIMPHLEPVDLVLTDPPYGVNKTDWDKQDDWEKTLKSFGKIIKTNLSNDGVLIMFSSTRWLAKTILFITVPYRWQFVWSCSNNMIPGDIGFSKFTPALIFSYKRSIHVNAQDLKDYPAGTKDLKNNDHPTPKPTPLFIYLLSKFLKKGVVLDPFLGSGTTAVACERLNRRWIGIEIEEKYCEIAAKRIEAEYKQRKLF